MALRLYNTLTRKKEPFQPIDPGNVRMYVCGPTVYDFAHIGNARPVIVFDVLFRLLRHLYDPDHVTYVRNITDVDDKINARAAKDYPDLPLNEAIGLVTEKTEAQFHDDVDALGCLRPTVEPRATEHIAEMRVLIERLVASRHAYVAKDHVLFAVPSDRNYGKLSRRSLDEMIAGARVDVAPYKRDPMDFVLWKPSKAGEPAWVSPAGINVPGRPGWHIECSAMSWKHLGETFDIHGGGIDLVFPHHENEIAQSTCAFHTKVMANTWLHNGFLQVEGEKMAKSLGNFVTINELLTGWQGRAWSGNAVRLAMLGVHYRQPLNWTLERLVDAERELFFIAGEFATLIDGEFKGDGVLFLEWLSGVSGRVELQILESLCDDLNTPKALSVLRSKYHRVGEDLEAASSVLASLEFLGLAERNTLLLNSSPIVRGVFDPEAIHGVFLLGRKLQIGLLNRSSALIAEAKSLLAELKITVQFGPAGMSFLERQIEDAVAGRNSIDALIVARHAARKAKDFKEADRIRDELAGMNVILKDAKDPATGELVTTWEVAR